MVAAKDGGGVIVKGIACDCLYNTFCLFDCSSCFDTRDTFIGTGSDWVLLLYCLTCSLGRGHSMDLAWSIIVGLTYVSLLLILFFHIVSMSFPVYLSLRFPQVSKCVQ